MSINATYHMQNLQKDQPREKPQILQKLRKKLQIKLS